MTTVSIDLVVPELKAQAKEFAPPYRSIWPLWVLLGINSLSLPITIVFVYLLPMMYYSLPLQYIQPVCMAVMEAQLFLLAFWLSFGGWPSRWRSLLVFGITFAGGLVFAAAIIAASWYADAEFSDDISLSQFYVFMLVGVPVMASALLWLTNAVFVIPSWYFGAEVNFLGDHWVTGTHSRTFGISQMMFWTAQVAVPFALLNLIAVMSDSTQAVYLSVLEFFLVIACCTPLAVVLLSRRISFLFLFAAIGVVIVIGIAVTLTPSFWTMPRPWWVYVINGFTVGLNFLALRWLGIRWTPRRQLEGVLEDPHA